MDENPMTIKNARAENLDTLPRRSFFKRKTIYGLAALYTISGALLGFY